jgi:hypothetical protein
MTNHGVVLCLHAVSFDFHFGMLGKESIENLSRTSRCKVSNVEISTQLSVAEWFPNLCGEDFMLC